MIKTFIRGLAVMALAVTFTALPVAQQKAAAAPGNEVTSIYGFNLQNCLDDLRARRIVYKYGTSGPCVVVIQRFLNEVKVVRGGSWSGLSLDGQYGEMTRRAVWGFQDKYRFILGSPDGIVGSSTMGYMKNLCTSMQNDNWSFDSHVC